MSLVLPVEMATMKETSETFFIECYIIELRTDTIYICATDEDIDVGSFHFISVPIQREEIKRSTDNVIDTCKLQIADVDYDKLAYLMNGFDFRGCNVTIYRCAYPAILTDTSVYSWVFSGYIDNPEYSDGIFSCQLKSRIPNIQAPNRSYQLCCNSDFGDDECTCNKEYYEGNVSPGSNRNEIRIGGDWPENYWKDGVVKIAGESRNIIYSSGDYVRVSCSFLQDMTDASKGSIQRGCDKTFTTCKERFGNTMHFSGFPAIPFESEWR